MDKITYLLWILMAVGIVSANAAQDGALAGRFTINADGDQVVFSQGNLQYQASTDTWQFAEQQTDYIGADNINISATYDGWIDLFGWATSGWQNGVTAYMPYATDADSSHYWIAGNYENDMVGEYKNADWGVYNAIRNGGNAAGEWRTLTETEWGYLLRDRANAQQLRGQANVDGVNGYLLLPDGLEIPTSLSFTPTPNDYTTNVYDAAEWAALAGAGCVFLPCAGYRSKVTGKLKDVGTFGGYWTATHTDRGDAYGVGFDDKGMGRTHNRRAAGFAVRLVKDVTNTDTGIEDIVGTHPSSDAAKTVRKVFDSQTGNIYIITPAGKAYNLFGAEVK